MVKGKLHTDGEQVRPLPGILVDGALTRLQPGEKIIFELEVVRNKYIANASIDFVFLSQDLNFNGLFKVDSFLMRDGNKIGLVDILSGRSLAASTSSEFSAWIDKGLLPLNTEFRIAEMLNDFIVTYPDIKMRWPLRKFEKWLNVYAEHKGGELVINRFDKGCMKIVVD